MLISQGGGVYDDTIAIYSTCSKECPKCSEENKKILDIIRAQDAARNKHDQFHAQLEKAEDGFSIGMLTIYS